SSGGCLLPTSSVPTSSKSRSKHSLLSPGGFQLHNSNFRLSLNFTYRRPVLASARSDNEKSSTHRRTPLHNLQHVAPRSSPSASHVLPTSHSVSQTQANFLTNRPPYPLERNLTSSTPSTQCATSTTRSPASYSTTKGRGGGHVHHLSSSSKHSRNATNWSIRRNTVLHSTQCSTNTNGKPPHEEPQNTKDTIPLIAPRFHPYEERQTRFHIDEESSCCCRKLAHPHSCQQVKQCRGCAWVFVRLFASEAEGDGDWEADFQTSERCPTVGPGQLEGSEKSRLAETHWCWDWPDGWIGIGFGASCRERSGDTFLETST
ncbi:hypothetical protein BJ508DRAFT_377989, partial [Ascobolus immersus RN42]